MLPILTAFTIGLVIGAFAGAWANAAYQVFKGKAARDPFAVPHGWERKP